MFANMGRYLRLEFGANSTPGINAITDISRSNAFDKSGLGRSVDIPTASIGGAQFHTHPETRHESPGFSWGDIQSSRPQYNNADYQYVFYGTPIDVGRKLDVRAVEGVSDSDLYYNQDRYAPIFK